MILNDSRKVQGAFLATKASLKRSQSEDLVTSKKHPVEAIGTHKIIPKIHKSLVLAHNIHKDCLLGVVDDFSDIYGAKHSPPSSAQRGPKGKIKVSTQKYVKSTSNASF